MSLSKQLGIGIFAILLLALAGSLWANLNNTRSYINAQLASHAQDTATSLGLSISPYLGKNRDLSTVDTMMNAIFDRGYYQRMTLRDTSGAVLLDKSNPQSLEEVPTWFAALFPLDPPLAKSEVSSGWHISGELIVSSHPGFAYRQLWQTAKQSFYMILGLFVIAGLMAYFVLREITRPLKAIVEQSAQISRRNFIRVEEKPTAKELRSIVTAVNTMSDVLAKMFSELTSQAEKYRHFAYLDSLTQLPNRRAFNSHISHVLEDQGHYQEGYLFIIRLSSLAEVNQLEGTDMGDAYLRQVATAISESLQDCDQAYRLFRISGADFVLMIENVTSTNAPTYCTLLSHVFGNLARPYHRHGVAHIGGSFFCSGDKRADLMARADSALASASGLTRGWQLADQIELPQSNSLWREQVNTVLTRKEVSFVLQPITSHLGEILYQECFSRFMLDAHTSVPTGQLIPASERLNLAPAIDKLVVTKVLNNLPNQHGRVGINLSPSSIADDEFCAWLLSTLETQQKKCTQLVFEVSEHNLVHHCANLLAISKHIKQFGAGLTIEHFGASMASFAYVRKVRPDYIKLDGSLIRTIEQHQDNQFFVQSLVNIAHGLNIGVIAEKVETAAEANALRALFIDYLQGYVVGEPTKWGS